MNEDMVQVWETIQTTLIEMGREACAQGSHPYGLRAYGDYYREKYPDSFRENACEEPITDGLAQGLCRNRINGKTVEACTEEPYPFGGRGDLVISLDGCNFAWIECKTAYKECLDENKDGSLDYEGDAYHEPGGEGSWKAGVRDISKDVKKLTKLADLRPPLTRYIGILLFGFDREANPITVESLYELLPDELEKKPWVAGHSVREGVIRRDACESRANNGFRERFWFWYRVVKE